MVMKMLKCKKEDLMTSDFSTRFKLTKPTVGCVCVCGGGGGGGCMCVCGEGLI